MKITHSLLILLIACYTALVFLHRNISHCNKPYSINVVIPAYNEEQRIARMLTSYCTYFKDFNVHFTVVLNGITDKTGDVVQQLQQQYPQMISVIESAKGKGNAVKAGFLHALAAGQYDYIGFVDADGSISPDQYHKLLTELIRSSGQHDGTIASRHMKESDIGAPRPFIKQWGRKLFYNRRIEKNLKLYYEDYQCGAKLFKRNVIQSIASSITETGWAIDLDMLYLCKHHGFDIKEVPIKWRDTPGSHLSILSSARDLYRAVDRIKYKVITIVA